tara:strand:+ start:89 stop:778 length:690 start_codon:yes stop_codon:yes gene_type:complete
MAKDTITRSDAAIDLLEKSQSALKKLPGTIREGGEARRRAAVEGGAHAAGAALRTAGSRALTSGAGLQAVSATGASAKSAAAAEMAAAEERALEAETTEGLKSAAIDETIEGLPTGADDYVAQKEEFASRLNTMLGDNPNVNLAMLNEMRAELASINDPQLRQLWENQFALVEDALTGPGGLSAINVKRPWTDPEGNTHTLFDLNDDAYVAGLRDEGAVVPTGDTNPLD